MTANRQRDLHGLRALVTGATSGGGRARFVAADLADAASIARLAKEVGDTDILVNNAGFAVWGPTESFEIASFDAMFATNVRAAFVLVAAFEPGMAARGTGSIINISGMAGRLGLAIKQGNKHND